MLSEDGGTLLVTRVGLAHEGLYVCQGSSWAGLAQAEVQVSVHGEICCPSHVLGRTGLPKGVGDLGLEFWEVQGHWLDPLGSCPLSMKLRAAGTTVNP